MRGVVTKWIGSKNMGCVLGEDGREYFMHGNDVENAKHIKRSNIVRFVPIEESEKKRPRAVGVRKTGHGKLHPFIRDLENIGKSVAKSSDPDKSYRLRDIQMLIRYFESAEDFEEYPVNIREIFRDGL